nr:MAG TPA: hypothetical protein [Caudoviricetes sp.]
MDNSALLNAYAVFRVFHIDLWYRKIRGLYNLESGSRGKGVDKSCNADKH